MKIWLLDYHPSYNHFNIENNDDYERLNFDGEILISNWVAPQLTYYDNGRPSDFLGIHNGALLLSEKAKKLIEPHLYPREAEFLPVEHEDSMYYFMHTLNVVNCIDAANSLEERGYNNRLTGYKEYAFYEELVAPHHLMRVKYHEGDKLVRYPFVSDHIYDLIVNSDLSGYQLIEIWDSTFSWKDKENKFNKMIEQSNNERTKTFDYSKAVDFYAGKKKMIVYSDHWAMKLNKDGELIIGNLLLDGTYSWINPIFIPPVLLNKVWGIKDSVPPGKLDKLKQTLSFKR